MKNWNDEIVMSTFGQGRKKEYKRVRVGDLVMNLEFQYTIRFDTKGSRWGMLTWGEEFKSSKKYTIEKLVDWATKVVFNRHQSQNVFHGKKELYGYIDTIEKENGYSYWPYVSGICHRGIIITFPNDDNKYVLEYNDLYEAARAYNYKKVSMKGKNDRTRI